MKKYTGGSPEYLGNKETKTEAEKTKQSAETVFGRMKKLFLHPKDK